MEKHDENIHIKSNNLKNRVENQKINEENKYKKNQIEYINIYWDEWR
ncbi:hypothetical protein [Calidifontibacillus erzurumensis]|uniref:Uncharacterized protein n=1 Tax=Calidifontibacillus erzurumensis TaxID=2741433 RepID=A0A8J8GET1_9BACI|nr:hypothetical protein [Calidifontibacillus erzurumensis]NSL52169.1 hypothetical protein [Calidifontibacillus erzurumensis]